MGGLAWFGLSKLFLSHSPIKIPEQGLYFTMSEKSFKVIETNGDAIRISLGKVNTKVAVVEILLGENTITMEEIPEGKSVNFIYENQHYNLEVKKIHHKIIGEEKVDFYLNKQAGSKNQNGAQQNEDLSVSDWVAKLLSQNFIVKRGKKEIEKNNFAKRLNKLATKCIRKEELIQKSKIHFPLLQIVENDKEMKVWEWLESKK